MGSNLSISFGRSLQRWREIRRHQVHLLLHQGPRWSKTHILDNWSVAIIGIARVATGRGSRRGTTVSRSAVGGESLFAQLLLRLEPNPTGSRWRMSFSVTLSLPQHLVTDFACFQRTSFISTTNILCEELMSCWLLVVSRLRAKCKASVVSQCMSIQTRLVVLHHKLTSHPCSTTESFVCCSVCWHDR